MARYRLPQRPNPQRIVATRIAATRVQSAAAVAEIGAAVVQVELLTDGLDVTNINYKLADYEARLAALETP